MLIYGQFKKSFLLNYETVRCDVSSIIERKTREVGWRTKKRQREKRTARARVVVPGLSHVRQNQVEFQLVCGLVPIAWIWTMEWEEKKHYVFFSHEQRHFWHKLDLLNMICDFSDHPIFLNRSMQKKNDFLMLRNSLLRPSLRASRTSKPKPASGERRYTVGHASCIPYQKYSGGYVGELVRRRLLSINFRCSYVFSYLHNLPAYRLL